MHTKSIAIASAMHIDNYSVFTMCNFKSGGAKKPIIGSIAEITVKRTALTCVRYIIVPI